MPHFPSLDKLWQSNDEANFVCHECEWFIGAITILGIPLCVIIKKNQTSRPPPGFALSDLYDKVKQKIKFRL